MVILGIVGGPCSGKETLALHLSIELSLTLHRLPSQPSSKPFSLNQDALVFQTSSLLSTFLKDRSSHYIIFPILDLSQLQLLRSTSSFFLLGIDCPTQLRYKNFIKKYGKSKNNLPSFLSFSDQNLFSNSGLQLLLSADRIIQNVSTLEDFFAQVSMIDFKNYLHIRPSVDVYFIRIAEVIASRAGCLNHRGGCVITNCNKIVATGYSGIPKAQVQCIEGGCEACFHGIGNDCLCMHAELNAIIEGKSAKLKGSVFYVKMFPCLACAQAILQVKPLKLVVLDQAEVNLYVLQYLENAGLEVNKVGVVIN